MLEFCEAANRVHGLLSIILHAFRPRQVNKARSESISQMEAHNHKQQRQKNKNKKNKASQFLCLRECVRVSEREREGERGRQRGLGLNCWSLTDRIDVACHMLVQFIHGLCQNHWHPCPQGFKRKRSLKKRGVCVRRKRGSNRESETERDRERQRERHTHHTHHTNTDTQSRTLAAKSRAVVERSPPWLFSFLIWKWYTFQIGYVVFRGNYCESSTKPIGDHFEAPIVHTKEKGGPFAASPVNCQLMVTTVCAVCYSCHARTTYGCVFSSRFCAFFRFVSSVVLFSHHLCLCFLFFLLACLLAWRCSSASLLLLLVVVLLSATPANNKLI